MHEHTHIHTYICTYIHTYIHTHARTHTHTPPTALDHFDTRPLEVERPLGQAWNDRETLRLAESGCFARAPATDSTGWLSTATPRILPAEAGWPKAVLLSSQTETLKDREMVHTVTSSTFLALLLEA